jgi:membrane fusion protein (multidrug efflux system)
MEATTKIEPMDGPPKNSVFRGTNAAEGPAMDRKSDVAAAAPVVAPPGHATAADGGKAPPNKAKRVMLGMVVLVAAVGSGYYIHGMGRESTDDAYVEGRVVSVAARTGGQVTKVLVADNQQVNAGDPLVELDSVELEARLAAANADLAAAEAQLALTETNGAANIRQAKGALTQATSGLSSSQAVLAQAKAEVEASRSRFNLADVELRRTTRLHRDGVVSASELDSKQSAYDTAKASLDQAGSRLKAAQDDITSSGGGLEAAEGRLASADTVTVQVQAAKARVDQAKAAQQLAQVALSYAVIKAPVKGVVSRRSVEVGHVIQPGTPLLALVPLDDVWVVANFKEDQIAEMVPGQPATVEVDTFGSRKFQGKVDSLAGATGSKFALLPPDNASGNFVKVVQRLPVLIRLDDAGKGENVLRPGMSAVVTVNTERR